MAEDGRVNRCAVDMGVRVRVRDKRTRLWAGVGRLIASNGKRRLRERHGRERDDCEFLHVPRLPIRMVRQNRAPAFRARAVM
jgi:hypothetical protein